MPFFFKRKRGASASDGAEEITWATNAPDHWPPVVGKLFDAPNAAVHTISFSASLIRSLAAGPGDVEFSGLSETRLFDDGALEVPFVVKDGDRRVAVFSYPEASPGAAAHFAEACALLESRGEPEPVWYAPEPLDAVAEVDLNDGVRVDALEPFDFHLLGYLEEWEPTAGNWAMWWATEADQDLTDWRDVAALGDIALAYESFEGVYSYAFSGLVKSLELIDDENAGPRIALPDGLQVFPVRGPEETELLVSASAEKGIRFHFHTETTSPGVRDLYWRNLANLALRLSDEAKRCGVPLDEAPTDLEASPLGWWRLTQKSLESGLGGASQLGVIPIE